MTIDQARNVARLLWCDYEGCTLRPAAWHSPYRKLCCLGVIDGDSGRMMFARGATWEEAANNARLQKAMQP